MIDSEDSLLKLLEDSDVKLGAVSPRVVQAWFDTDCSDLLKWMCSHIKKNNYLSGEEEYEFNQLDSTFSKEQTMQEVALIENERPGLLKYEDNLGSVEYLQDLIEICENQEEEYNNILNINQLLQKNLSNEFDAMEQLDDKFQKDLKNLQNKSLFLSQNLESLYNKNILIHHEKPFFNEVGSLLEELEQNFFDITNVQNITSIDSKALDSFVNPLSDLEVLELKKRIFKSKFSLLSLKVELKSCKEVEYFLNQTELNASSVTEDYLKLSLDSLKSENEILLKNIEEVFLKMSQKYVNTMQLEYYQTQLNFHKQTLLNATETNEMLYKLCSYFILLLIINSQQNEKIVDLRCFLQNISKSWHDCKLRKMAMSSIVNECLKLTSKDFQQALGLLNIVGSLLPVAATSLDEISKKVFYIKHTIDKLRKNSLEEVHNNYCNSNELVNNIEFIQDLLESEGTCRLVTIPQILQVAIREVNEDINNQNYVLKDALKETQNTKK